MKGWANLAAAIAVATCLHAVGAPHAFAASESSYAVNRLGPADVEAHRQALLARMLQNPGDLDTAFEYAELSSQVGDYEAAISTLERMLIFAPNTPQAPARAWHPLLSPRQLRRRSQLFRPSGR